MSETRYAMEQFFSAIQLKAFRQAEIATGCRDEALDIVQEAMCRLAQKYSEQREDWPKLFQRILQNAIRDWYRRKKVRSVLFWLKKPSEDEEGAEQTNFAEDENSNPMEKVRGEQINEKIFQAIKALPFRQQQAFLLRAWWECDTKDTAAAMSCTEGSVKTHYSRAIKKLNELLSEQEL